MEEQNNSGISPPKKNRFKKFAFIFLLLIVIAWFIYYFICGLTYSEGTRSGILTKVSKKGFVFKTYEGEINIGGLNQADGTIMPATVFRFSCNDKKIYDQLEVAQGHKVVLHYREVIKTFFWQGETNYFIDSVNSVK